jgi:hypothetical protein
MLMHTVRLGNWTKYLLRGVMSKARKGERELGVTKFEMEIGRVLVRSD